MTKKNSPAPLVLEQNSLKDLSFFALFSLIFGSMMGSGVFDIPQNIAHSAGLSAIIVGWLITVVGMLALGSALVYITLKKPEIQSGIYGYARYGFGHFVGFNSAWGYWLNAVLGNASYLIYIFATLSDFYLFKSFAQGNSYYALITESLLIWLVYFLIIKGIKEASIVNIIISTIKIIALAAIIFIFIYGFKTSTFLKNLAINPHFGSLLHQVKSTMLVTVWDFLGIEAACIYALRAKKMQDVARATMGGVILVLVIDILISILPFGVITDLQISELTTPSSAGVMSFIINGLSGELIRVAVIISVVGALLAWNMLATNIFYVAAADGSLPKFLTKMNKKNVPSMSLLVSVVALQIFIIIAYFTNSLYLVMIQLATSLILIPYLLSALFAFKLMLHGERVNSFILIKGILALIYGIWLIYAGGLKYLAFSSILYALGMLIYTYARWEQNKKIFANRLELVLVGLIIMTAISSGYFYFSGILNL